MATIVCFHAHPDDECIATGGVMAKYSSEGHRIVLVSATRGEHGEVAEGFLAPDEALWQRREKEVEASAAILGVHRGEFLDYIDSGMMGTPENDAPDSFWQAAVEEAAERLANILREEQADVLTIYDEHGTYGHPDHMKVHTVGKRAAELAGTPRVYEAVIDRDEVNRFIAEARAAGMEMPDDVGDAEFGVPTEVITHVVDVRAFAGRKREAMAAHASQIGDTSFFLTMPPEIFEQVFGSESFVLHGATPGHERASELL